MRARTLTPRVQVRSAAAEKRCRFSETVIESTAAALMSKSVVVLRAKCCHSAGSKLSAATFNRYTIRHVSSKIPIKQVSRTEMSRNVCNSDVPVLVALLATANISDPTDLRHNFGSLISASHCRRCRRQAVCIVIGFHFPISAANGSVERCRTCGAADEQRVYTRLPKL